MITLVIKGTRQEAVTALTDNNVSGAYNLGYNRRFNETLVEVNDTFRPKVVEWFNKDVGRKPPYPAGTLLYYAYTVIKEKTR